MKKVMGTGSGSPKMEEKPHSREKASGRKGVGHFCFWVVEKTGALFCSNMEENGGGP